MLTAAGNPVNLATGAMWDEIIDFAVPGRTPTTSLSLVRSYTAVVGDSTARRGFGPNWQFPYETHLVQVPNGQNSNIAWIDEHGGPNLFLLQNDGSYLSPGGQQTKLTAFSDHYEIRLADHTIYSFSKAPVFGKLLQITDKHGEATVLAYNSNGTIASVSAPFAGSLSFAYNGAGLITQVKRDRDNLSYTYSYTANGQLASVTDFQNRTWSYSYVTDQPGHPAQGLLETITDPLGRVRRFSYDSMGRALEQFEPGGGIWHFAYGDHRTAVTNPSGATTKYFFDANLREITRVQPDGSVLYTQWNAAGFKVSQGYDMGGKSLFGHDANGNMNSVQRPFDPSPTTTVYDQTFNVPTLVTPLVGAATQYSLNSNNGDVVGISRAGSNASLSLMFTRDIFGNLLSVNNGVTTYSDQRDANGLLTYKFDLHNPATMTYDTRGRLTSMAYQSGRTIRYTYNNDDQVLTIVDSAGPTTTNQYDVMGRLTQKTISAGGVNQVTSFVYDDRDRLVSTTDPLGRVTTNHYDPVHVIDKPSSVTDPAGRATYFVYDQLQRLIRTTDPLGAVTSYTWDQRGNMTSVTDANGNVTRYAFDLNNRKIREDRPSVAGTTAARRVTLYFYDGADHLVREVTKSATGGQDRAIYFQYDALDRLVRKIVQREGSTNLVEDDSSFSYENELDATLMNSAVNGVASLGFTNESAPPFSMSGFSVAASQSGNPFGLITGNFSIARDVTGEIASIAKNGATLLTKSYDSAGRLTGVAAPGGFSTALGYDGFGRKVSVAHSNGEAGSFQHDLLDRITAVSWTGPTPISEGLNYDLAGNITQVQRENGSSSVAYDAVDQLVSSTGQYSKSFAYDLLGNRVGGTDGPGNVVSNFLLSNGSSSFLADLDGFGDTIRETSGAAVKNYAYRADDLLNAAQSGSTQLAYYFDALKRRVAKVVNLGGTTYTESYVHQGNEDRILMAKGGDGAISTYLDGQGVDEHLAEIKNGIAKGYVTDHLGSLLNGDAAGSAHGFGLFGEGGALSPAPTSSPVSYGFAGRELDESGLYYNRARNYSPVTGRFLSQDPLGHASGDDNGYRYAVNNPVNFSDPSGLMDDGPPLPDPVNENYACIGRAAGPFLTCLFATPEMQGLKYGKLAISIPCLALLVDGVAPAVACIRSANLIFGGSSAPLLVSAVTKCSQSFEGPYKSCLNSSNSCPGK